VRVRPGTMSVLDASRSAGIAHASVCGGRGRCSTCRVRLGPGGEHLPPPDADELRVLNRVGASPGVRLACQIRPRTDLVVVPLLPPQASPLQAFGRPDYAHGAEREIAVLFADLRSFTRFAEMRLPYDVVFIINTYAEKMGAAVEAAGGRVDKFIGDGVMALFGVDGNPQRGARQALAAARNMALALAEMNETLRHDLPEPLRMGIGVHFGPAIVGEMGYGHATTLTAIGDTVNTASRLESATKELGGQLVVSQDLADMAGLDSAAHRGAEIEVRGRAQKMKVVIVDDAGGLPA
jgi:adenylate cyclase